MPYWNQLSFQDPAAYTNLNFILFHDFVNLILTCIITFVAVILIKLVMNTTINKVFIQAHLLECVWTLLPGIFLIQLGIPSLFLLYLTEEEQQSAFLSLKVTGHQWYWSYDYPELEQTLNNSDTQFDSYMTSISDTQHYDIRLLETDNRVSLPMQVMTRALVSSADVLHSWAVPSLAVKADAIPGRINQIFFEAQMPGVYYGQCSEICGANHSFMPIAIQFLPFSTWYKLMADL